MSDAARTGRVLAADGRPLKRSLARALRAQKLRALMLIAPLLLFILITFIAPIVDMLFRSVENQIVSQTLPRTVVALAEWEDHTVPPAEDVYAALAIDFREAAERRAHTRLGGRLNYEATGISSLFRQTGRGVEDIGEEVAGQFAALDPAWDEPATWVALIGAADWIAANPPAEGAGESFEVSDAAAAALPLTSDAYRSFARTLQEVDGDHPATEAPWNTVYMALHRDLVSGADVSAHDGPQAGLLAAAAAAAPAFEAPTPRAAFAEIADAWADPGVWAVIEAFSDPYTAGYFLAAADRRLTPAGVERQPEELRVYVTLFQRTLFMSLVITGMCILLGYPIAYLLSNLPLRASNLLLILVLLPFWTSLLVRTSAWKVLLQQQGVINDLLVWIGLVANDARLTMINNQLGTIIAMTHILLPFMILPLYSVMKTIPPSYVRAAKSLGANNWTAFWRVYFPQSIPGIGAGCILVFILSIGYYITPEIVGGRTGTFISNRIAFHIRESLNWGLAAALGTILLVLVMVLYWLYDRIVGIDNVKLG